jgi:hypothetical protein
LEDQKIIDHHLYPEYAKMRIRERELLHEVEEGRQKIIDLEDLVEYQSKRLVETKRQLADADLRFARARKKLDDVERKLREDMGIDRKGC